VSGRALLALAAAVLAGCAPTGWSPVPPAPPAETTPTRDCSRQFDENDAGFQTCRERSGEP
jgi:hypothetical protein